MSISSPAPSVVQPNGARHSIGLRAAPSSTAARFELAFQVRVGDGRKQSERVRMNGIAEERLARRDLDDAAGAHHRDFVGDVVDDREVVRDEQVGEPELGLQVLQQVQDLRLDRHVEGGDGLVAKHEVRLQRERPRDADALPLPAGEAVRIAVEKARVESDEPHQLLRHVGPVIGVADVVDDERLAQDVEDGHPRAERAEGILEDVLDAAAEPHQVVALRMRRRRASCRGRCRGPRRRRRPAPA